jgi:tetratricopeptide (TPR) repeat protein
VALDRAWLLRERGDLAGAAAAVEAAAAHGGPDLDVTLLRGLLAAQGGDIQTAVELATRLKSVEIKQFMLPVTMGNHSWVNSGFWHPDRRNVGAWKTIPSDYLRNWILALAWLHEGQPDMAGKAFRRYSVKDIYPFGWRFWREAGRIYEVTGRPVLAAKAWAAARVWIPYSPFFPTKVYSADLGRLTGRPGVFAVHVAFDRFYVAGHRLVLGTRLTEDALSREDELEKLAAAGRAESELEACRDAGWYPSQASLLLGAVYHHVGDLQSAVMEVEAALAAIATEGDLPGTVAVLGELANLRSDRTLTGIQAFYGQSGVARARWAPTGETAQELAALRAAYEADAGDANRRDLARYLIRHDEPAAGRALVAGFAADHAADMVLLLEADRALGESARAGELVAALSAGRDPYDDAEVWTLAGFVCLDDGREDEARIALGRALELDPGNRALRVQMDLLR